MHKGQTIQKHTEVGQPVKGNEGLTQIIEYMSVEDNGYQRSGGGIGKTWKVIGYEGKGLGEGQVKDKFQGC